ncbi:hypothetical protein M0802_003814 [Mischocyttarus mexicanus]|nr:hypothetical protein M0802_003814 [Mischocyttarus mexicanus]
MTLIKVNKIEANEETILSNRLGGVFVHRTNYPGGLICKLTTFTVDSKDRAPLGELDEDIDDFNDEVEKELEVRTDEEELGRDGGTQHRLSPRLHDIEEEDDEEGRNTRERPYQKKSPTPSGGGGGSRTGWRSRRSVTTAGAPGHQHHVIASAAATAQARMQAEQGSIGELRGYHNLRSRRHTLANVR